MNRHAGPPEPSDVPPIPEPSYAERARTLVYLGRTGTLSTLSRKHPGHPFGSVMPYATDESGRPIVLISSMAMHTQNLLADRRASLTVTQPGSLADPLASARATLMGNAVRVGEAENAACRAAYLDRHPNAAYWVDFDDFSFFRLDLLDIYYVGGFAAMDWVSGASYLVARPDPLADAADAIIDHMNRDHRDALLILARAHGGKDVDEGSVVSVDRLGMKLRLKQKERLGSARIAFPREVSTPEETRAILIEMLRDARQRLAASAEAGR